jgi:hypothetical protein
MRISPWAWLAWALITLVVFGVLEWVAVTNDVPNDTLTRTIVRFIPWVFAALVLLIAVVMAVLHWWDAYHKPSGRLPLTSRTGGGVSRMSDDLKRALWTAVQAFGATFFVLAAGVWEAPNLVEARAVLVAAAIAGGAAAFSVIKNWVTNRWFTVAK